MSSCHVVRVLVASAGAVVGLCAGTVSAQAPASTAASEVVSTGVPQRDTLLKLMQPISLDQTDARLEDVITFIKEFSGAPLEVYWADDANPEGLDKEKLITMKVNNVTVLALLERVLAQAADGDVAANTWQLTDAGECQIGPKARLNKFRRVEIYDINDLLLDIPEYDQVPLIDLQSVLQQSGGGGGGGGGGRSPFRDDQQQQNQPGERDQRKQEKADDVVSIITELVETEQWQDNGGTGGSIRYWQGTLIVNAPDYMHRQLNGYPYWPKRMTRVSSVSGRRYVTLGTDNGIATIDGFKQTEATAVVGGQIIRSGPGGGR